MSGVPLLDVKKDLPSSHFVTDPRYIYCINRPARVGISLRLQLPVSTGTEICLSDARKRRNIGALFPAPLSKMTHYLHEMERERVIFFQLKEQDL